MVPVSVIRTIDGVEGAVTYWLEGTINETDRRHREIPFGGHCDMNASFGVMNVFDILVFNVDRNLGNILYDERTWMIWLIDHTRAFGTQQGTPRMIRGQRLHLSPQVREALGRVTRENLSELEPYLHPRQIMALERRARWLLQRQP